MTNRLKFFFSPQNPVPDYYRQFHPLSPGETLLKLSFILTRDAIQEFEPQDDTNELVVFAETLDFKNKLKGIVLPQPLETFEEKITWINRLLSYLKHYPYCTYLCFTGMNKGSAKKWTKNILKIKIQTIEGQYHFFEEGDFLKDHTESLTLEKNQRVLRPLLQHHLLQKDIPIISDSLF